MVDVWCLNVDLWFLMVESQRSRTNVQKPSMGQGVWWIPGRAFSSFPTWADTILWGWTLKTRPSGSWQTYAWTSFWSIRYKLQFSARTMPMPSEQGFARSAFTGTRCHMNPWLDVFLIPHLGGINYWWLSIKEMIKWRLAIAHRWTHFAKANFNPQQRQCQRHPKMSSAKDFHWAKVSDELLVKRFSSFSAGREPILDGRTSKNWPSDG